MWLAQSVWSAEFTNCIFAAGWNSPKECPVYDSKQPGGEGPVVLYFGRIQSTPLLRSLPGSFLPGMIAPDNPIYGLNRIKQIIYAKLNCLK